MSNSNVAAINANAAAMTATTTTSVHPVSTTTAMPQAAVVESHVQVAVRCRPLNEREKAAGRSPVLQCKTNTNEIAVAKRRTYAFDKVYGQYSTQQDVFKATVQPVVDAALSGYNCTVFAYGQTGTGKTHTMQGALAPDDDMAGIAPRCVRYIFDALQASSQEFSVKVSYLQLYNEELQDLLAPAPPTKKLRLMDDPKRGGVYCQHLLEVAATSARQVHELLATGVANRTTSETLLNDHSSRSHSILTLRIHSKESNPGSDDLLKTGQLHLVDLAGSECVGRSGARNARAREAGNINQSLLTLGRVITALVDGHPHIPYRDSKLTRLLAESLGGRAKTTIIATLAPCADSLDETLSTLEYAHRAKHIKNKPEVNQKTTKAGLLKEFGHEIEALRSALDAARTKDGVFLPPAQFAEMQERLAGQCVQLSELEDELVVRTTACNDLTKQLTVEKETSRAFERAKHATEAKLQATEAELQATQLELKATYATLQVTQNELQAYAANELVLLQTGERATALFCESEDQNALLSAKIDRKTRVEDANSSLTTSFAATSATQITAFQTRLQQHEEQQQSFASDVTNALAQLHATHASDQTALRRALAALDSITSAQYKQQLQTLTTETQTSDATTTALMQSIHDANASQQRAFETLVLQTAQHAAALAHDLEAAAATRVQALDAVTTTLARARTEMATFFVAQSDALQSLQATIDASLQAQTMQLEAHTASVATALRDAQATQQHDLEALKQQLSVAVDAVVASQTHSLTTQTQLLATHAATQTQELARVRSAAERSIAATTKTLTTQRAQHDANASAFQSAVAQVQLDVTDAAAQHRQALDARAADHETALAAAASATSDAHTALVATLADAQRDRLLRLGQHDAAAATLAVEVATHAAAVATTIDAQTTNVEQNVRSVKRTIECVAQAAVQVTTDALHEASTQHDALETFVKKRKIDEPTGTTPTKQNVTFPTFHATVVAPHAPATTAGGGDTAIQQVPLKRTLSTASHTSTASSSNSNSESDATESLVVAPAASPLGSETSASSTSTSSVAGASKTPPSRLNRLGGVSANVIETTSRLKATASSTADRKLKLGGSGGIKSTAASSLQAPKKFR